MLAQIISAMAAQKMGKKNPIFGQELDPYEQGPAIDPALEKRYGDGPIARPTFWQSAANPQFANQIRSANMQFGLTPIQAEQGLAIAEQQMPRRTLMQIAQTEAMAKSQNALENQFNPDRVARRVFENRALGDSAFEFEKQVFPEKLDMQLKETQAQAKQVQANREAYHSVNTEMEADRAGKIQQQHGKIQNELKAAADKAELEQHTSSIAELRQAGALPPELSKYSDEILAKMLKGNLDSANLAHEASSRASMDAGLPALGAHVQKFRGVHGMGHGDVFGSPLLPTLDPTTGQTTYDRNPAYQMSPEEQMMQSLGGSLEAAAEGAGIPRLTPSIPTGERPVTQPIGGPARLAPSQPQRLPRVQFADSPEEPLVTHEALTKEDLLEQLGVELDENGQLVVPKRGGTSFLGIPFSRPEDKTQVRSTMFGLNVDKYTEEEKAALQDKVDKILSNPRIPFRKKAQ